MCDPRKDVDPCRWHLKCSRPLRCGGALQKQLAHLMGVPHGPVMALESIRN